MKAYHIINDKGPDALRAVELPERRVGAGQVLVRVRAVSLNYRDLMVATGRYPVAGLPIIPVSDGAGEVVGVGEGVTRWKTGDRVVATFSPGWLSGPMPVTAHGSSRGAGLPGVLAEHIVVSEDGIVPMPAHLSFEEAATLPCAALTAWNALVVRGQVSADETVLVLGTGGVSIFGLQFAKLHGARVIVTSSSDEKLARAKALGADEVINYRTTPEWEQEVLRRTGGEGAHHILEVGGRDTLPRSLRAAAVNGMVYVIGGVGGGFTSEIALRDLITRNVTLRGVFVGSRGMLQGMNAAIAQNRLKPAIDRVFPFAEAREAYRHLERGAHFGKVVISI